MLKIENSEVVGWEHAIRGMRNPMNSWDKSDSEVSSHELEDWPHDIVKTFGKVGPNDRELMTKLRNAGTDHRKFMRMITVYMDITAPLYWWKEFDTYKVGTVANSCSTMHKIAEKMFVVEDFSTDHLIRDWNADNCEAIVDVRNPLNNDEVMCFTPFEILRANINALNVSREAYLATKDKKYWWQMIQLLPSSYNQKRTVMLNYEVLANIYKSRRNHKLDEWHILCDWIETLPYSELITGTIKENPLKSPNEIRAEHGLPPIGESGFRAHYLGKPMKQDSFISNHDRLVISAYTGFLMCDFNEMHAFIEKILGRPVFTHELGDAKFGKTIQENLRDEWLRICDQNSKKEKPDDQFESC